MESVITTLDPGMKDVICKYILKMFRVRTKLGSEIRSLTSRFVCNVYVIFVDY